MSFEKKRLKIKVCIICILFTTQYNQNIHNEGQRHIIVCTDLNTEM